MTEIRFRELDGADVEALAAFFEANNLPLVVRHFNPFPLTADSARDLLAGRRLDRFYGAFADDRMAGFAMLRGWDEGYQVPSFGILIDRSCRGRGFGRQMLVWILAQARGLGCERVRLSVYRSNAVAARLYAGVGFVEAERHPVTVIDAADERVIMIKELGEA